MMLMRSERRSEDDEKCFAAFSQGWCAHKCAQSNLKAGSSFSVQKSVFFKKYSSANIDLQIPILNF